MMILKCWVKELLSLFVFLRFSTLWELYEYISSHNIIGGILTSVFTYQVDKRAGYIGIGAKFHGTPYFPHGLHGVYISEKSEIGRNAVIFQQVTIGAVRTRGSNRIGNPVIGDNCYIGAGAKIIGDIRIGNNCRIGANAVVYEDMPDNSIAVCSPTRIIQKNTPLDNRFFVLDAEGEEVYYDNGVFRRENSESVV